MVRYRERTAKRRLERARLELDLEQSPHPRRHALTHELKLAVFQRDGGVCTRCGSTFDLQYDHILPFALGGATTVGNLQLLCSPCNQAKGKSL
ncbi:MAG: HNH endonuclease [Candidatus Dormibacteria bacterium]